MNGRKAKRAKIRRHKFKKMRKKMRYKSKKR